jgi:hypothetical protein
MRRLGPAARTILVAVLCVALIGHPALAVVIETGDGSGNTTAPPDDPGWANMGMIGSLVGVYLGRGWVLTASHVGAGAIVLQGVTYQPVEGSRVRFDTPPGAKADLIVYRIEGRPPLPSLVLSDATPSLDEEVTMMGNGWNREAGLTYWDIDWVEVTPPPPPAYTGYKRIGGNALRWGRNAVTATDLDIVTGSSTTRAFEVIFDQTGGVTDEAQAATGDSGGPVFVKRGGQWQLAGVLFAIGIFENQPSGTAVFGQTSYAADVAFYRDQILAVITPAVPAFPPLAALPLAGALAFLATVSLHARRRPTARTSGSSSGRR